MKDRKKTPSTIPEQKAPEKLASLTRRQFVQLAAGAAVVAGAGVAGEVLGAPKSNKMDTPVLSCGLATTGNTIAIGVCAGLSTGAPAGFSLQWMTCADLAANNGVWYASDDPRLCKASFSGNANNTNWNLGTGGCVTVIVGGLNDADPGVSFTCNDPLVCETCYVFRAFAHANKSFQRSDFTANKECTTDACEETSFKDGDFCTRSQGFYGNGNDSRDQMIACFGGDPDGVNCTSAAGTPLVTIGGGVFSYTWVTTGACVDVQPGGGVFLMDSGLAALRSATGGAGGSSFFTANGNNATNMGTGGGLASQTAALTLNIAGSGAACTGSPAGYGSVVLCKFAEGDAFTNGGTPISAATAAALNGQTVSQVLAAANAYLGGAGFVALPYSLGSAAELNELVANLNLAFDLKDWDGDGVDDGQCGGMTAFAESHLCPS